MPRRAWLACLVSLMAIGCSASSKSRPASAPGSTSPGAPPSFSGSASSKFCSLARQFSKNVNFTTSSDLRATFQQFDVVAPQILSSIPSELENDANLLVNGIRQVEVALKAVDYDSAKVDPASLQGLQDPKFTAASDRFTAYNTQVCGINAPAST